MTKDPEEKYWILPEIFFKSNYTNSKFHILTT
jgi:hypothetical protein